MGKNATAKGCAAIIHKTTSRHFVFTEKVYGTVTESIRRQWQFAPGNIDTLTYYAGKETTKTSTVQGGYFYYGCKQHTQVNCTAKWCKMFRHVYIYPTALTQGALVASS